MTHIYKNPVSLHHDHTRGGTRYVNVWYRDDIEVVYAGERHHTRAFADRGIDRNFNPVYKPLYRVVVKFK